MKKCIQCGELVGDNVDVCFNCGYNFREGIVSKNDLYEYDVVTVNDNSDGSIDVATLKSYLTKYASDGWRLKSTLSNELGHNSYYGTNSTIDQTVLIFERCIQRHN